MRIGTVLKKYRLMQDINVRDLSAEISLSAASLTRIEAGHSVDATTLVKLINWLCANEEKKDG